MVAGGGCGPDVGGRRQILGIDSDADDDSKLYAHSSIIAVHSIEMNNFQNEKSHRQNVNEMNGAIDVITSHLIGDYHDDSLLHMRQSSIAVSRAT